MTIAAILEKRSGDVITVGRDTQVREAVALLSQRKIGAVPVTEGGRAVGIMSERDVMYCLACDGAAVLDSPVEQIRTSPAITVRWGGRVLSALSLMSNRRIRHLPVVDGDRLVGIVSIGDLVKRRLDELEAEDRVLHDYADGGAARPGDGSDAGQARPCGRVTSRPDPLAQP